MIPSAEIRTADGQCWFRVWPTYVPGERPTRTFQPVPDTEPKERQTKPNPKRQAAAVQSNKIRTSALDENVLKVIRLSPFPLRRPVIQDRLPGISQTGIKHALDRLMLERSIVRHYRETPGERTGWCYSVPRRVA